MTTIAIVYHSGYGHTAVVAEAVSEGVTRAGATPKLLKIENAAQDFTAFIEEVTKADAVIFGARDDLYGGYLCAAEGVLRGLRRHLDEAGLEGHRSPPASPTG